MKHQPILRSKLDKEHPPNAAWISDPLLCPAKLVREETSNLHIAILEPTLDHYITTFAHHPVELLEVLQYVCERSNFQLNNDQLHITIHPPGASLHHHNQNNVGDQHHPCL